MVEHQTAIMAFAFGLWSLVFIVCPLIATKPWQRWQRK